MKNLSNYQLCELSGMAQELLSVYSKYFHVHGIVTKQLEKELYKFKNDLDTEYQRRKAMRLNIEEVIAKELSGSHYANSYLLGNYTHSKAGEFNEVEILAFNSSCPDLDRQESQFVRYHIFVSYFGQILYRDSNVIDRNKAGNFKPAEIAQRGVNYLRHRAGKIEDQINNL